MKKETEREKEIYMSEIVVYLTGIIKPINCGNFPAYSFFKSFDELQSDPVITCPTQLKVAFYDDVVHHLK